MRTLKKLIFAASLIFFAGTISAQKSDTITIINFDTYEEVVMVFDNTDEISIFFRADGLQIDPWSDEEIEISVEKLNRILGNGFSIIINDDEYEQRMRPTEVTLFDGDVESTSIRSGVGIFASDVKGRLKSGDKFLMKAFTIYVSHDKNKVQKMTFRIK